MRVRRDPVLLGQAGLLATVDDDDRMSADTDDLSGPSELRLSRA
jgi:hypothetical protein